MTKVHVQILRIGGQHAAAGCSVACIDLLVAVARSHRRALAGDPCRHRAYSWGACDFEASQADFAEAAYERSRALPETRRDSHHPRRCRRQEVQERLGKPSIKCQLRELQMQGTLTKLRSREGHPYLDQVLALGLCDQGLELRGSEGVDKAGFGNDEK